MGFDDQPHVFTGLELEGVAGGQGQVDFHFDSAPHAGGDDYVALLERCDAARDYVSCAQANRRGGGQQDVAGTDPDAEGRAYAAADQRGFEDDWGAVPDDTTIHRAALGADGIDNRVEYIFETYQLSHCFLLRGGDYFVGRALGDDASGVEDQDVLAERENFFSAVRNVEDGDAVCLVPLAEIVDDFRFGGGVERG
jgi:hypothetical protein